LLSQQPDLSVIVDHIGRLELGFEKVLQQTKPAKKRYDDPASEVHSVVRKALYPCLEVPLEDFALPQFKRFSSADAERKQELLLTEVIRYIDVTRNRFLAGQVAEVSYVQPEICGSFWQNTHNLLENSAKLRMMNEKPYVVTAANEEMDVHISGKTDHVIQYVDSSFASLTIEDKANSLHMTDSNITQCVTQITSEVEQMDKHLNYAPAEYVGLLQNGPIWILVMRKICRGKITWTYTQSKAAFIGTVKGGRDGKRIATKIYPEHCIQIARIIEHAYCIADIITNEMFNPEIRPNSALQNLKGYLRKDRDDKDDSDVDGSFEDDGDANDNSNTGGKVITSLLPAPSQQDQSAADGNKGKHVNNNRRSLTAPSAYTHFNDYFILPLSMNNVACHTSTLY